MINIDNTITAEQALQKLKEKNKIQQYFLSSPIFELLKPIGYTLSNNESRYVHEPKINLNQTGVNSSDLSTIYLFDDCGEVNYHVKTLEEYKAGMSHILHMVYATSDYPWYESGGSSTKYKTLDYLDECILQFQMFDLNLDTDPLHLFTLGSESLPDIRHEYNYENKQLLQKYAPYYRRYRISNVIGAI